jgi:aerobic carbon-monoxide dehydrogenase small subunit
MVPESVAITLTINGRAYSLDAPPHHTLLQTLRALPGLTGTKECCSAGECGACTILLDGHAVNSCLVLACEADGSNIVTIEGLAAQGKPDKLQQAFLYSGAVQCGFCIPGMILSAKYLLQENASPSVEDVQEGLCGNLCRCAGYSRIIDAVLMAAKAED